MVELGNDSRITHWNAYVCVSMDSLDQIVRLHLLLRLVQLVKMDNPVRITVVL